MIKLPIHILTIDTIKLFYKFYNNDKYFSSFNFLESKLEKAKSVHRKDDTLPTLSGYYMGMQILVSPKGLTVRGSLCKCAIGNNYYSLTREEMKDTFVRLSDALQISLIDAQVLRIDIGVCILTRYPPEFYFQSLGACKGYECWERTHSHYYENTNRTMIFYNKRREVESKRNFHMLEEMGENVLRCELRFTKDLSRQFNKQKITGEDLFDPIFFNGLVIRFRTEYGMIYKNRTLAPIKDSLSSGDGIDYTLSALMQLHGINRTTKMIEALKHKFKRGAFVRYTNKLNSLKYLSVENTLINELNSKLSEIIELTYSVNKINNNKKQSL